MTVTPSELQRMEQVDRILDEVNRQLRSGEYMNAGSRSVPLWQLSPRGASCLRQTIEDVISEALLDA